MNFFKRLFKIGSAEAHSALNQIEDPIKMTEEGIRNLKSDLAKSMESLAQVKASAIRSKNEASALKEKAESYEKKAMLILQKAEKGDLSAEEADRLAKEALVLKEETSAKWQVVHKDHESLNTQVNQLQGKIQDLKNNINKWEAELRTLKARVKVSSATKNINKQLAKMDNSSTTALLERMKEKVMQEEALAEAYGELAENTKSVEQEIDAVANDKEAEAENALQVLKEKLKSKS